MLQAIGRRTKFLKAFCETLKSCILKYYTCTKLSTDVCSFVSAACSTSSWIPKEPETSRWEAAYSKKIPLVVVTKIVQQSVPVRSTKKNAAWITLPDAATSPSLRHPWFSRMLSNILFFGREIKLTKITYSHARWINFWPKFDFSLFSLSFLLNLENSYN